MESRRNILHRATGKTEQVAPGFAVRRPMPSDQIRMIDPWLLLDHAGPVEVKPTEEPGGIDAHPHRGFETVTVVLQGELSHRDSAGNRGALAAGDVQWMTAGSGIVHEERHGKEFSRRGGTLELIQLWVNLPSARKDLPPAYQDIRSSDIPIIEFGDHHGFLRVIAGSQRGHRGPARTETSLFLFDVGLEPGATESLEIPIGETCGLYVIKGSIQLSEEGESAGVGELLQLDTDADTVTLHADAESRVLAIGGVPIDEPVAMRGPFVMTNDEELSRAFSEFKQGKYGTL